MNFSFGFWMMSSGPALSQVVEAVRIILDPSSDAGLRAEAHALCESVRECAPSYGFQLVSLEMPLGVRLFGLNLLEGHIRSRLVLDEAPALRDGVWSLLALVVQAKREERRLMQDKSAMLVAQLAMRIWPQYWPDFFDKLLELVATNGKQLEEDGTAVVRTEMGLRMARMVVDEVHPREGASSLQKLTWDDARRPELQKALSVVLPLMIKRLYVLLPHCAGWTNGRALPSTMKPVVETVMEAFGSIALWTLLEKNEAISCYSALVSIAGNSSDLSGTALDVLSVLASRPTRPQEIEFIAELIDTLVEPVMALLGQYASASVESEGYENFKKLADVFVTLATANIALKRGPSSGQPNPLPKKMEALLDLMLQLSAFPSLLVVANAGGSFWHAAAKNERLMSHSAVTSRLPRIFLYALMTLAQEKAIERLKPCNVEDFGEVGEVDADSDFDQLFATHQNRTMELLRQAALHHPDVLAGYCGSALTSFLTERGGLVMDIGSVALKQWDALLHATDAVLKACLARMEAGLDADRRIAVQVTALGEILCIPAAAMHPEVLFSWFAVARVLVPALGIIQSPKFPPLVQQLFQLALEYELPLDRLVGNEWPADRRSAMRNAIRSRAGGALSKACHAQPALFRPALDYLVDLFRGCPTGGVGEGRAVRLLSEMLLVLAGGIEDSAQRLALIRMVLSPVVESLDVLSVADHRTLLVRCGLSELLGQSGPPPDDPMTVEFRGRVSDLNALLYTVIGQLGRLAIAGDVKSLIVGHFVPAVAVNVGRFIVGLNGCYSVANFDKSIRPKWEMLLGDCGQGELIADNGASILPPTEKLLDASVLADSMDILPGKSLRGWLYMLRVACYMNYGALFVLAPTAQLIESLPALITGCESFSITQWVLLTRHLVHPVLVNLPTAEAGSPAVRQTFICVLERFGTVQLEAAWQRFSSNPANDLQAEAAQETLLSTATAALLNLLFDVLNPVTERDKRADSVLDLTILQTRGRLICEPSQSSLALLSMRDAQISSRIVSLLAAMLRWKPALTIPKVLGILLRWMPVLMENRNHHEVLFGPISRALLLAVSSSTLGDSHATVGAALTELYKWQVYFEYDVLDQLIVSIANSGTITQELRRYFLNATGNTKSQRTAVKSMLIRPLQMNALTAAGVTTTVPRLPDRLVVMKKLKAQPDEDAVLDLASFFND